MCERDPSQAQLMGKDQEASVAMIPGGCMKSAWAHHTWRWGTGLPGAGSETGVYLEYLKLCLKLYRKLSIYLTHIPDLLFKFEMPRLNVAFNMPA